jgi:hypothetical protein
MSEFDTKSPENSKKLPMGELVSKLRKIQSGLRQNLANLHQDLATLDWRPEFSSIQSLKKDAEARAINLEAEVKELQEELRAIRELLGLDIESNTHVST